MEKPTHFPAWQTNLHRIPAGKLHGNHPTVNLESEENLSKPMFYSANLSPCFLLVISVVMVFDFCTFAVCSSTCLFCLCAILNHSIFYLLFSFVLGGWFLTSCGMFFFLIKYLKLLQKGEKNQRFLTDERKPPQHVKHYWLDFFLEFAVN